MHPVSEDAVQFTSNAVPVSSKQGTDEPCPSIPTTPFLKSLPDHSSQITAALEMQFLLSLVSALIMDLPGPDFQIRVMIFCPG